MRHGSISSSDGLKRLRKERLAIACFRGGWGIGVMNPGVVTASGSTHACLILSSVEGLRDASGYTCTGGITLVSMEVTHAHINTWKHTFEYHSMGGVSIVAMDTRT